MINFYCLQYLNISHTKQLLHNFSSLKKKNLKTTKKGLNCDWFKKKEEKKRFISNSHRKRTEGVLKLNTAF